MSCELVSQGALKLASYLGLAWNSVAQFRICVQELLEKSRFLLHLG